MDPLKQPIQLELVPPPNLNPLAGLIAHLKQVQAAIDQVNHALATGPKIPPQFNRTAEQMQAELARTFKARGTFGAETLAKSLGLDEAQTATITRRLRTLRAEVDGLSKRGGLSFSSIEAASRGFAKAFEAEIAAVERRSANLAQLLTPRVGQVAGAAVPGAGVQTSVSGEILLTIPAAQIKAVVAGDVTATGAAGGGTEGGGRRRGKYKGLSDAPQGTPETLANETGRTITQTERGARVAIETLATGGQTLTQTFDDVGNEIKRVTRDPRLRTLGAKLREDLTVFQREAAAGILSARTGDKAKDLAAVARIKDALAERLQKSFADVREQLPSAAREKLGRIYTAQADVFAAQAREAERASKAELQRRAQAQAQAYYERFQQERAAAEARGLRGRRGDSQAMIEAQAAMAMEDARINAELARRRGGGTRSADAARRRAEREQAEAEARQMRGRRGDSQAMIEAQAAMALADKRKNDAPHPLANSFEAMSPLGFLRNTLKVGAWMGAVGAAMAPLQLASYSLTRFLQTGEQTARLEQVFRGVGGTARELTDDVIRLAAANGRSTDEAMESAVAWSRLGLNRVQVNEAVRVSLMAANVAELSAGEATKHLSALLAAYSLSVADLDGVLGMLNNTSNKFNVTNADLLTGLSRTATVARQAGIPLAELQGIIGAAVGRTGQTGANIGNAVKSVLVQLSNPQVQEFLSNRFKLEVGGEEVGQVKTMSQVMRELFLTYTHLNDEQRKDLTRTVAGRTQAARFVAILESYIQAQRLAADAQLNLNSAQEENAKITAQQKANLIGLRTEWDRFVVNGGNAKTPLGGSSPGEQFNELVKLPRNVMRLFNNYWPTRTVWSGMRGELADLAVNPIGRMPGFMVKLANRGLDWLNGGESGRMDRYIALAQSASGEARAFQGYQSIAQRLRTLQAVAADPGARREEVSQLLRGEDERLALLYRQNDVLGLQREFEQRIAAALAAGNEHRQRANQIQADYVAQLNEAIAAQEAAKKQAATAGDAAAGGRAQEKLQTLIGLKREAQQIAQFLEDTEDVLTGDPNGRRQRTVNWQATTEMFQRQIESLYQIAKPDTALGQLDREAEAVEKKLAAVEQLHDRLRQLGKEALAGAAFQSLQELRGQRAAVDDPAVRAAAAALDRRSLFARRAGEAGEAAGLGTSEGERLGNRERYLRQQLDDLRQRLSTTGLGESDAIRALVFENALMQTREQIQSRITKLAGEERQARLEGQREFEKSLLFAGPGDLLRKLAAQRLSQRGVTAGQWFSLSPEMRQELDTLNGGDSMRRLRQEGRFLRGRAQTPEAEAAERTQPRGPQDFRLPTAPALNLDAVKVQAELSGVAASASQVSAAFNTTRNAVIDAGIAFEAVLNMLKQVGPPGMPVPGLNTGEALGEMPRSGGAPRFAFGSMPAL